MILSRDAMDRMDEAELRRRVIMPLMESIGYRDVFEWHGGAGELGKDIVGWKEDDFGDRRNTAVVAKADRISGARSISTVTTQVRQAFNTGCQDPSTGDQQRIHHCWVVTNKRLGKEAREQIQADLGDQSRSVTIHDGDQLWELVERHLPVTLVQVLTETQHHLEQTDIKYGVEAQIGASGLPFAAIEAHGHRLILKERYPGQLDDEPFTVRGVFNFPETPEGQATLEEFQSAIATGSNAKIPGEFIQVELPEAIQSLAEQLFGTKPDRIGMLEISSASSSKPVPVRIDVNSDDGDSETLPYIEWRAVQVGRDQITLSNEAQPYPIRVVQTVNFKEQRFNLMISKKDGPIAAPLLLQLFRFLECMAKPGKVQLTLIDPGLPLGSNRQTEPQEGVVDPDWITVLSDLAAVQAKTGVPIYIPDDDFTEENRKDIELLHHLLRRNEITGTWTDMTFALAARDSEDILALFDGDRTSAFYVERDESMELFGAEVPLGRVRYVLEDAVLANGTEIREALSRSHDDDETIEFQLTPGKINRLTIRYLDW